MKKSSPLGARLNTILENARLENENKDIFNLEDIFSSKSNVYSAVEEYNRTGLNHYYSKHYKEAIEQFKKALSLRPEDGKIHYNLALVYDVMGHLNEALEEYRKAVQLNSLDAEAHNNLGIVYYHKGFYEEAILEFKEALKVDSHFNLAKENLGLVGEQNNQ